jgi:hypothetical protein
VIWMLYFLFLLSFLVYPLLYIYRSMMYTETLLLFFQQHPIFFFLSLFARLLYSTLFACWFSSLFCSIHTFSAIKNMHMRNFLGLLFIGNKQRCVVHLSLSILSRSVWRNRAEKSSTTYLLKTTFYLCNQTTYIS